MRRWAVVAGGLLGALAVAAGYVASSRTADAACTADPPGVVMPKHDTRTLERGLDGWDCVLTANGAEVDRVQLGWWPSDARDVWAQPEAPPDPASPPAVSPTPSPNSSSASSDASESPRPASAPPSVPLLESLDARRLVVEHADAVWAQVDSGPWQRLGPAEDVRVVGDGRWSFAWSDRPPTLRSVADPEITCDPPDGFFDVVERRTAVIHEGGSTSVFVASEEGRVTSTVCQEPGRTSPIDWRPPTEMGDGEFGPIVQVQDGITLVSYADAEGNLIVHDESEERRLIDYAISGPMIDAERELLVYVAQEGGMHFAGGTLVVTDLAGGELHRVDLGGTSQLRGLVDGLAIVERVRMPEFATTHHLVVGITTGTVVDEEATQVGVRFVGS